MKFTLGYNPPRSANPISHRHKVMLVGSCFAENIGGMMLRHHFCSRTNPGGILFDAANVCRFLQDAAKENESGHCYMVERGGRYFSYLYHSSLSAASQTEMEKLHRSVMTETRALIRDAGFLIITFGTAFTYYHNDYAIPVANCHKQEGSLFTKRLNGPQEIVRMFSGAIPDLLRLNNNLQIIFTVSPVKYLKDGPVNNNISKSALLLAVHDLVQQNKNCSYFPAYELVTDDLRDYRFFNEDMAHPSDLAIRYVWEKFSAAWFSPETRNLNSEIEKLNKALAHRVLHPNPGEEKSLREHIKKQKDLIRHLEPSITF